jgi:hypothetical protein
VSYTGFKLGNRVVFNVAWGGTKAWKLKFKVPKEIIGGFKGKHWEFQNYDDVFGEAIFRPLKSQSPDISELKDFFVEAYKRVSGMAL